MSLTEEGIVAVPGFSSRWVRLPGGAKAHYMTSGESGPNVILLHGGFAGFSAAAEWSATAPFLGENGFRVYCPDQPGWGLTEAYGEYHLSLAGHVDFIQEFANALCLDDFYFAGRANNSLNYIIAHPERILRFAVVASGNLEGLFSEEERKRASEIHAPGSGMPRFEGTEASMRQVMEAIHVRTEAVTDDVVKMRTMTQLRNADGQAARREYNQNADPNIAHRMRMRDRVSKLSIPGIYLFGANDAFSAVEIGNMQEDLLPNIQFFYPEEFGHQGPHDQPELFNDILLEFFRDGKVSRKTADRAKASTRRPENPSIIAQA